MISAVQLRSYCRWDRNRFPPRLPIHIELRPPRGVSHKAEQRRPRSGNALGRHAPCHAHRPRWVGPVRLRSGEKPPLGRVLRGRGDGELWCLLLLHLHPGLRRRLVLRQHARDVDRDEPRQAGDLVRDGLVPARLDHRERVRGRHLRYLWRRVASE